MPRLSPIASAALFVVAVLVGVLISRANHDNAPPSQKHADRVGHQSWEPTPPADTPTDAKRVAANRDYPWYAALNGVEDMQEDNRLAQLFSSNPDLKARAVEDEAKRRKAIEAKNTAEKRLGEAETLSVLANDPLPRWAARAVYLKTQANWMLRWERAHVGDDQAQECRHKVEDECLNLIIRVRKHWDANYAGIHVVTNTPVTALP